MALTKSCKSHFDNQSYIKTPFYTFLDLITFPFAGVGRSDRVISDTFAFLNILAHSSLPVTHFGLQNIKCVFRRQIMRPLAIPQGGAI